MFKHFLLFFIAVLVCPALLSAQQTSQKTISLDFKDVSVAQALHEINQRGGHPVTFREELAVKETKKITLKRDNITVWEAVKICLEGTGLTCTQQENGKILVGPKQAEELLKITGRVVDDKGEPIAGATVIIYGTTAGVASDSDGRYSLPAKADDILQVSFIGYKTEVVPVNGKIKVDVVLKPTAENLEEVAVVAFGTQKKESVVSAITTVRHNAAEWHIPADKVGVIGFSAGGHLASTMATHYTDATRPDFQILIYPVITLDPTITHMGTRDNLIGKNPRPGMEALYSNELQVTTQTPPAFIFATQDDDVVPVENSIRYEAALTAAKVPAELHIYPTGGHGYGKRPPLQICQPDALAARLLVQHHRLPRSRPLTTPHSQALTLSRMAIESLNRRRNSCIERL